jgi:hypothetical protein
MDTAKKRESEDEIKKARVQRKWRRWRSMRVREEKRMLRMSWTGVLFKSSRSCCLKEKKKKDERFDCQPGARSNH